jgi:hypothetical protein
MSRREHWITKHLSRLRFGQFLRHAGEWLAGFCIVFGMIVLLVKRMAPDLWPHVLWLAAAAIPVTWAAWWLSRRERFTRQESVALLDRSLGTDGLLMALTEVPDADWESHLPQLERRWAESIPRLRPKRFASCVGLPLLFALGVCFVPLRSPVTAAEVPQTAGQQAAQRLEELLTALKEADLLEEQEEEELTEEIAKLVEETQRAPLTHEKWETVDALEQKLRLELTKSELQAQKLSAAASALLAASQGEGPPLSDEQMQELEEELLETLTKQGETTPAAGDSAAGSQGVKELLQKLTKNGTQRAQLPSDPAERQQLLNELREMIEKEQLELAEIRKQCEGGECSQCGQGNCEGGQCQGNKPGQCSQCGGQCESGQSTCTTCQGNIPGRGGITRGRGDAELSWGDESDEQGVRFKETVLPPGFLEDAKDEVVGVRLSAPEVDPASTAARGSATDVEPTTGRETWGRRLRPRHKEIVREYFDAAAE